MQGCGQKTRRGKNNFLRFFGGAARVKYKHNTTQYLNDFMEGEEGGGGVVNALSPLLKRVLKMA